jgi:hypothetical protein
VYVLTKPGMYPAGFGPAPYDMPKNSAYSMKGQWVVAFLVTFGMSATLFVGSGSALDRR